MKHVTSRTRDSLTFMLSPPCPYPHCPSPPAPPLYIPSGRSGARGVTAVAGVERTAGGRTPGLERELWSCGFHRWKESFRNSKPMDGELWELHHCTAGREIWGPNHLIHWINGGRDLGTPQLEEELQVERSHSQDPVPCRFIKKGMV